MEQRNHKGTVELRANAAGAPVIAGYAAVFNRDSADMGFIEQVDPAAFNRTLTQADVRALGNHEADWLLGRSKSGTLRLFVDSIGLGYEIDVNQADPDGVRAVEKVRRGDLDGSSFSFQTIRDEWNWEATPPQRRLLEVALVDVGPVTFPAYPDATAAMRSALEPVAKRMNRDVADLVSAMQRGEIRSLIDSRKEPAVTTESRALNVVWGPEDGFMDLLGDCEEQLDWSQCAVDVTLALDKVLVYDYRSGEYAVAPISVDDANAPTVADATEWTSVDAGWVETTPDVAERTLSRLGTVEQRAGARLSAESKQLIDQAMQTLRELLGEAEGDDDDDTESNDFGAQLEARERELGELRSLTGIDGR